MVENALRLKKIGNRVMTVVGGREVHPINVRVGGWYRAPSRAELEALVPELEWALETAVATVTWAAGLDFPELEHDYEFVALDQPGLYPIDDGRRLVSSKGLDIEISEWLAHFEELHVPWSNALHARLRERGPYLVGPARPLGALRRQARRARPRRRRLGRARAVVRNPFRSIVVRSVEVVEAA